MANWERTLGEVKQESLSRVGKVFVCLFIYLCIYSFIHLFIHFIVYFIIYFIVVLYYECGLTMVVLGGGQTEAARVKRAAARPQHPVKKEKNSTVPPNVTCSHFRRVEHLEARKDLSAQCAALDGRIGVLEASPYTVSVSLQYLFQSHPTFSFIPSLLSSVNSSAPCFAILYTSDWQ